MIKTNLKDTLATHLMEAGQVPTEQELTDYTDSLVSFFEILIETDKKLMKADEPSNNRNSDTSD